MDLIVQFFLSINNINERVRSKFVEWWLATSKRLIFMHTFDHDLHSSELKFFFSIIWEVYYINTIVIF